MTETDTMSLTVFDPIKAQLAELTEKDAKLVFDHRTPDGEKELRSYVRRLRGDKTTIADLHKTTKQGALAFGRQVDSIKNELTAGVQKIIDARMKPLDDIEAAKRAAAEALIEAERLDAERIEAERLANLKTREEEVARKEAEIKAAEDAANAEQREAERIVREKRIAEEAAEKARKEAEEKAERERLAAIAAAEAEKDRLDEIERKRVENQEHRDKVETDVYDCMGDIIAMDGDPVANIINALIDNRIPHVTINY